VREELAGSAAKAGKKAKKTTAKQRRQLEKKAARTATKVKRKVGVEPEPRRWPWLLAVLAVGAATFAILRRLKASDDSWTPAPSGDGPVPSYREDPVPSTPSDSGKAVSSAETSPGDATPPDTDLGMQTAQPAPGPAGAGKDNTPETATSGPVSDTDTPTAGPSGATEGPGGENPATDATNTTDSPMGEGGTPLANRGQQPLNPQDPA
jgi:hypothetical protein